MIKKGIILILCLSSCVGLGGCSANDKSIDKSTIEESSRKNNVNNEYNEESAKNSTLTDKLNEYFNMGYDFDEEDSINDFFSNSFNNMINKDDIKSIDDITDDIILAREGAYFEHSKKNNTGDCLELDYEDFTGVYKWCSIEAKKKAGITIHIEGTIDKNIRLVLVQNDKSIQNITDSEKITIDKGESRIVLCGYKSKGKLKLSLTYNKKKIIISSSIY
jgi:hypothetical protein